MKAAVLCCALLALVVCVAPFDTPRTLAQDAPRELWPYKLTLTDLNPFLLHFDHNTSIELTYSSAQPDVHTRLRLVDPAMRDARDHGVIRPDTVFRASGRVEIFKTGNQPVELRWRYVER